MKRRSGCPASVVRTSFSEKINPIDVLRFRLQSGVVDVHRYRLVRCRLPRQRVTLVRVCAPASTDSFESPRTPLLVCVSAHPGNGTLNY